MLCTKRDITWLTALLSDKEVFFYCSDDGVSTKQIKRHVETILSRPDIVVLSPVPGKMVMSFMMQNAAMWDFHTIVRPGSGMKGKEIKEAVLKCCAWMIKNKGARKFMTRVPAYNREAMLMAAAGGMVRACTLTSAFLKQGKLHDLVIYQSRDEDVQKLMEV